MSFIMKKSAYNVLHITHTKNYTTENLYDAEYFEKIKNNTRVYNKTYEEIKDFVGCYPIYDDNKNIID